MNAPVLKIDIQALHEECARQPDMYYDAAQKAAEASYLVRNLKLAMEAAEAAAGPGQRPPRRAREKQAA